MGLRPLIAIILILFIIGAAIWLHLRKKHKE
jgi:hypothetical protein